MTVSNVLSFPPDEILSPRGDIRKNYEHIILWMLYNNEYCEWADFINAPLEIGQSTLSNKLNVLKDNGLVEKEARIIEGRKKKLYYITSEGKSRYHELSISKQDKKRKLNFPPAPIKRGRNYQHWILWMVYNNAHCKWSDFQEEPIFINQSSLSKNLKRKSEMNILKKLKKLG